MAPVETYRPDLAREAAFEVINARWFGDRQAFAFYQAPDDYLDVGDDKASVVLYTRPGNRGDWDRTDRLVIELYAPGTDAVHTLEAVTDRLVNDGDPHDLEAGYVDEIRNDLTPYDEPFPGGGVNQARAEFLVTHRPQ